MAKRFLEDFGYDLQRIPRERNGQVDALAKLANAKAVMNNMMIIQETLQIPYIDKVMSIKEMESWIMSIIHYLKQGKLLNDKNEAKNGRMISIFFQ